MSAFEQIRRKMFCLKRISNRWDAATMAACVPACACKRSASLPLIKTAFISSSGRDADDAVYGRDGYDYDGYRLRVEFPRSGRGSRGGGYGGAGGGAPRGRYGPPSRRSEYRVVVSGEQTNVFFPSTYLFDKTMQFSAKLHYL